MKRKSIPMHRTTSYNNYVPLFIDLYQQQAVVQLRMKLGAEGYGIYCMLLQLLRSNPAATLTMDYDALAFALHLDAALVKCVVEDFDLFSLNRQNNTFTSPWLYEALGAVRGVEAKPSETFAEDVLEQSEEIFKQDDDSQLIAPDLALYVPAASCDFKQNAENQQDVCSSPARTRITNKQTNEQTNELPTLFSDENSVGESEPTPTVEQKEAGKFLRRGLTRVKAVRLNPPTVEEVAAYAQSKGYEAFDAEHFVDYHTEKGWQTVHGDMVSWQSAVRTWHRNDVRYAAQQAELRAERQQRQERIDAERRAREEARDAEFRRQSEEKHRAWMMKNADANEKSRLFHEQRDREIAAFVQEAINGPDYDFDNLPF